MKSGSKFHARCARTEIQQAILGTDVARGGERTPLLHVIEVLAGHRSGRDIAYRKPYLSAVRLVHIVRGALTAHPVGTQPGSRALESTPDHRLATANANSTS